MQTCLWSSKKKQNPGCTGTYIYILTLGPHPNSCIATTFTAQAQTHAKALPQSESCCRRQPDYTLSFLRLVFEFTFSVDPYLTDSPSYRTSPPTTGRVSGTRLLEQNGSFKRQLGFTAFIATLYWLWVAQLHEEVYCLEIPQHRA